MFVNDIGEGSSALYCLMHIRECCSPEAGVHTRGLWKFKNDTNVLEDRTASMYLTRGFSSIHLNRRGSPLRSTGVYRCLIPGLSLRTLSITIYGE